MYVIYITQWLGNVFKKMKLMNILRKAVKAFKFGSFIL